MQAKSILTSIPLGCWRLFNDQIIVEFGETIFLHILISPCISGQYCNICIDYVFTLTDINF